MFTVVFIPGERWGGPPVTPGTCRLKFRLARFFSSDNRKKACKTLMPPAVAKSYITINVMYTDLGVVRTGFIRKI